MGNTYPGTQHHQDLLTAVVNYYRNDPRVLALSVFGSLSRGTWDPLSDLDLDVVIGDDIQLEVLEELRQLCSSLIAVGEHDAVIVADGKEAGDVVFASLTQLSARYHTLATTSPNIVDSLQVLTGSLDPASIAKAGLANRRSEGKTLPGLLDQCVRYILAVDVALQRGELWGAIEMLHRIRGLIMEMFAMVRNGARPLHSFQAEADPELQARLAATLPQFDKVMLQNALEHTLEFLETNLSQLTRGQIQLSGVHRNVLAQVRARQLALERRDRRPSSK
jgi:predicted nucleotidyltransferase